MWIQVEDTIRDHDKIFKLSDILGITDAHAVGLMVCLWTWVAANAPDGDLSEFPPRAIAAAAKWEKSGAKAAARFCDALREARFVEQLEDGRTVVRNWDKRQGMIVDYLERQREKTKERVRKYRERKKKEKFSEEIISNENCNVTETLPKGNVTPIPNHTLPDQTQPDHTTPSQQPVPEASEKGEAELSTAGDGQKAALRRVCKAFSQAIHTPGSKEQAQLQLMLEKYGEPVLLAAVEDARGKGKSVSYVGAILKRWQQEGIPAGKEGKGTGEADLSFDLDEYERMTGWGTVRWRLPEAEEKTSDRTFEGVA